MREPGQEDEVLGKAYDARLMRRLWAFTRPHTRLVLATCALFPAVAVLELIQPYLIKVAIDDHILRRDWAGLGGVAALFLLVLLGLYALRAAQAYLTQLTGQRVIHDLRAALFAHLQRQDARFYDRSPVGRLMTRVLNDGEAIQELFTSGLVSLLGDVVVLTGVVVIMLGMNWKLALVTFALVPLLVLAAAYFRVRARDSYRVVRTRLARMNAFLQESLQGMSVIQLFAREARERETFAQLSGALRAGQFRSTFYDASLYATVEALGSAAVALLLWYGGGQVVTGALTFGGLVAFLEYTGRFYLPIRDLGAKYTVMQAAVVSAERIFGLLDTHPSITSPTPADGSVDRQLQGEAQTKASRADTKKEAPVATPPTPTPAVEFKNVWFAYEGEQWVLRDCSFTIAPGERVALVGPTGEGKTTIARLMIRAYDVARGRVLVDGVDVREWDLQTLRRHVGLVPQEVFLFSGTVEDNLRLTGNGAVDRPAIERALEAANAERFVAALPRGLREELRERGVNLSQGQRQLLAIARAIIYNPRVLALDEATSSIDPESEARVRVGLARLLEGRTSLVIAHRLSTIQRADRILVLHRGEIREAGGHAELLALGGLYSRLYELQFGLGRS
ncbi:MAG TPA: ABC transporter ATP-binding protein [Candidatus Dormibacteraeota bacterium]|nr:ABC transporter ATP-binding protein [Candidatus Dormibacteraeota bacterium]